MKAAKADYLDWVKKRGRKKRCTGILLMTQLGKNHYVKIYLGASGLKIKNIRFEPGEKFEMPF